MNFDDYINSTDEPTSTVIFKQKQLFYFLHLPVKALSKVSELAKLIHEYKKGTGVSESNYNPQVLFAPRLQIWILLKSLFNNERLCCTAPTE